MRHCVVLRLPMSWFCCWTAPGRRRSLREGRCWSCGSGRCQTFVVINKVDVTFPDNLELLKGWAAKVLGQEAVEISAVTGQGISQLRESLVSALPRNPFFFPHDEVAVQPVRFFVAELVRETVFEEYEQEVPYSTVVRIEEFRETADPIYIRATVYVERESQKAILIGQSGARIQRLGQRSRSKIEEFLGVPVYLDLWVKLLPGWRRKTASLEYLGFAMARRTRRDTGSGSGGQGTARSSSG